MSASSKVREDMTGARC